MKHFWILVILLLEIAGNGMGEPLPPAPTNQPLKQISRDIFELGSVRLDKSQRTVKFPAQVCLTNGIIEYFLVNTRGKTYESLLSTDVEPYYIHLAMLLIGAKGAPTNSPLMDAPAQSFHVNHPGAATNVPSIPGDAVSIKLTWPAASGRKQARAEDWLIDLATKTNASPGPWNYNGSRVLGGAFIAQREGSIVAMIDDIDAMMNNPRHGSDNDQIWQINSNAVPPTNVVVEMTFKLETPVNR